jgi:hypothetical protein
MKKLNKCFNFLLLLGFILTNKLIAQSSKETSEFSIIQNIKYKMQLNKLLPGENFVPKLGDTEGKAFKRLETKKNIDLLNSILTFNDNHLPSCFTANSELFTSKVMYGIRRIEWEIDSGKSEDKYVAYLFYRDVKSSNHKIETYIQSDAFGCENSESILNDFKIIADELLYLNENKQTDLTKMIDTKFSYFNGHYFLTQEKNDFMLNLSSPTLNLAARKVFKLNCIKVNNKQDCCFEKIFTEAPNIAYKDYEIKPENPNKLHNVNPYTITLIRDTCFYKFMNSLKDCKPCKKAIEPKNNLDEDSLRNKNLKKEISQSTDLFKSSYSKVCFKSRVVFGKTVDNFEFEIEKEKDFKHFVYSLFFDREGYLYPNSGDSISTDSLCYYYASLNNFSEFGTKKHTYNDSLYKKNLINRINSIVEKDSTYKITFIILGFNNNYVSTDTNLIKLYSKIKKLDSTSKHIFIKIFWDGTYNSSKIGAALDFDLANGTSYEIGDNLRQILREIKSKKIYMISHSLGANIICQSVFNQLSKVPRSFQKESQLFYENSEKQINEFSVPEEKSFNIALIAPAMPGKNTFIDLFDNNLNKRAQTNTYNFIVGFNSNDQILDKFFGLENKFSSTSLGCNLMEVKEVEKLFNSKGEKSKKLSTVEFSGTEHNISEYLKQDNYELMLKKLYSLE